jgi:cation diffusion facilitator CzcD-associated flavoprotein CzcO
MVTDPVMRERLMPRGFPFATKRPSVDSDYFPTFNRDNVTLVDIRAEPIESLDANGLQTTREHYDLDVLVYATGFDAMTGSLLRPEIVGRRGRTLAQHWASGPRTYLGPFVNGFPNLFIVAGPGSPSLLSNVLLSIEQHVDWLAALLSHMRRHGLDIVEAAVEAEDDWVAHVNARAEQTLYPKARSYYMGDDMPGKPRVFMPYSGGVRGYRRILERVATNGYEGLAFNRGSGTAAQAQMAERRR